MTHPLHMTRFQHGSSAHFFGVHGWGSTGPQSFSDLAQHLPEDASLFTPDLPGCGQTPPLSSWTPEAVHQSLLDSFDAHYTGKPMTVIGSCSGSFHALPLAIARPEQVKHIVLLEPFAFMPWFFGIFLKPLTGYPLYKMVFDNPIGRAMTRASLKRQGGDQDKVDMVGNFGQSTDLGEAYKYLQYYGTIVDHKVFARATQPVHIICGENSFKAIHKSLDLWKENWPELTPHVLPGIGHMLSQEAPELTASLIFNVR